MSPIPPLHLVCAWLSPPLALALSLSLHRHPYVHILPSSRFIRYKIFKTRDYVIGEVRFKQFLARLVVKKSPEIVEGFFVLLIFWRP